MNKYFKMTLCVALPLAILLGCSKQSSSSSTSSAKGETTQVDSTSQQTTENKSEVKTVTFVNDTHSDLNSTLTYIVDGDNVLKHSGHNVYDPEAIGTTAEKLKTSVEEAYKGLCDCLYLDWFCYRKPWIECYYQILSSSASCLVSNHDCYCHDCDC